MDKLNIELCPETGICSIIRKDGTKVDLMPEEVNNLRDSLDNPAAAQQVVAEVDADFAKRLVPDEIQQLATRLKKKK